MKKIIILLIGLLFSVSSCETLDHWLFNASDYHLREQVSPSDSTDTEDYFWDEMDFDLWLDDQEYD